MGQNIQAKAADKQEAEEIEKHLLAQDEAISAIVERLPALTPRPADEAK